MVLYRPARLDSELEAEGAEFLVLGLLMVAECLDVAACTLRM